MSKESDGADMAALLVLNMRLLRDSAHTVAQNSIAGMTGLAMVEGRQIKRLRSDIQRIDSMVALYERWLESVS